MGRVMAVRLALGAPAMEQGPSLTATLRTKRSFANSVCLQDKHSSDKVKHLEIKKLKRTMYVAEGKSPGILAVPSFSPICPKFIALEMVS